MTFVIDKKNKDLAVGVLLGGSSGGGGGGGDVTSVNGRTGAVVLAKTDVGLSNVDNTSDLNKPISTATQTALNLKENTITAGTTAQYFRGDKTWQTLNKTVVGLSNVDNTSDLNKPISTATQTALNLKADKSTTYTKTEVDSFANPYYNSENIKSLYISAEIGYEDTPIALDVNGDPVLSPTGNYTLSPSLGETEYTCQPFIYRYSFALEGSSETIFTVYLPDLADTTTRFNDGDVDFSALELIQKTAYFNSIDPLIYDTDSKKMSWYFQEDVITLNIEPIPTSLTRIIVKVVNGKSIRKGKTSKVIETAPLGDENIAISVSFKWNYDIKTWETKEVI